MCGLSDVRANVTRNQCGPIREIKVRALSDQGVATVEFNSRVSAFCLNFAKI